MTISILIFIFLVGISFGSFANVIILRLPKQESLIRPHSHCFHCTAPIAWYDNIPLISFCLLGGKCRHCKTRISCRYPLVELLTGMLFVMTFVRFVPEWLPVLFFLVFNFLLICVAFIDYDHYIIPDVFSIGMIMLGILYSPWNAIIGNHPFLNIMWSLVGGLSGGLWLLAAAVVTEKIFKKETMGGGDIKLIAGIGTIVGWHGVFYVIIIASLLASLVGIGLIVGKIRKKDDPIPFGPFLSIASIITVLFFEQLDTFVSLI